MPLGGFRLNTLSRAIAAAGGGAPAIPTTTWTVNGHITSTFGNTASQRQHGVLGYQNSRYFVSAVNASTTASAPRIRIGSSSGGLGSTSLTPGFSPDTYVSVADFNPSTNGGNWVGMMASSSSVRFTGATQANWSAGTAVATTNPTAGTFPGAVTRTSGTNDSISICSSKYPSQGDGYLRVIGFWQTGSNINASAYTLPSRSGTMTNLFSNSNVVTSGVNGAFLSAAGFTNDTTQLRWVIGYLNSSGRYQVQIGTSTHAASHGVTSAGNVTDTGVTEAGMATMWDDATAGIYIACGLVLTGSAIYIRPIKITDWSTRAYTWATAESTLLSTSGFKPRIMTVQRTNGLCLVTYLKASPSNTLYGKWISVDPTTLAVTIGSEFTVGTAPDSLNINHYGLSCVHDATYKFIGGAWAAPSGGDGGPFNITGT